MKNLNLRVSIVAVFTSAITISCTKLTDIPESRSQIETSVIFADSSLATSALLNIYFLLGSTASSVNTNMNYLNLYADEYNYTQINTVVNHINSGRLLSDNSINYSLWSNLYSVVYRSNAVLEGVKKSTTLSVTAKNMLNGEALFLRSFANFYITNLYDNAPLLLTTDVGLNAKAVQNKPQVFYDQLVTDLQNAKTLLNTNYTGSGKVRATKWSASALLARVYLFQGRWEEARSEASVGIDGGIFGPLPDLDNVFVANSKEAILQIWNANGNISDASAYIPSSATSLPEYVFTTSQNEIFGTSDGRRSKWVSVNTVTTNGIASKYYFGSKYKNRTANTAKPEYVMALRIGEQYLIRAEALARLNRIPEAIADLNVIRTRATGLNAINGQLTQQECVEAVFLERRRELFGEWANRFLDLKRWGQLDLILTPLKPAWKPLAKALPIPLLEISYNSNLIQNDGY